MNHPLRSTLLLSSLAAVTLLAGAFVLNPVAPTATPPSGGGVDGLAATAVSVTDHADLDPAPRREAAPRRAYDLEPGDELRLACRMATHGTLTSGDAEPQMLQADLRGELHLLVLARRNDELALLMTMTDTRINGDAASEVVQGFRDAMRDGTVVHLSSRGAILGYRFPAAMPAAQRNQLRSLLTALRVTLGTPGDDRWETVDADATGIAEMTSAWCDDHRAVDVHKTAYRSVPGTPQPRVAGHGRAALDGRTGWWRLLDYEESCELVADEAGFAIRAEATFHSELRGMGQSAIDAAAFDWSAPWAPACGAGEVAGDTVDAVSIALAEELRGATLPGEFSHLRELLARGADDVELFHARQRMMWLLRNDASALRQLECLFTEPDLPQQLVGELFSAVGAADTAACQGFLLTRLGAGETPTRIMAALALFQGTSPIAPTIDALRATFAEGDEARAVQSTGMLLLGAMAARDGSGAALHELLGREGFARDHGLVVDWLEALGNTGGPEVTAAAMPAFAAAEANERAAAIAAVRHSDDPAVGDAVLGLAEHDDSPLVRSRAFEHLGAHPTADLVPAVERVLADDLAETVRGAALSALATAVDPAVALPILRRAAMQDPSASVRQLAAELLQGR